jgi:hypothetical protein
LRERRQAGDINLGKTGMKAPRYSPIIGATTLDHLDQQLPRPT